MSATIVLPNTNESHIASLKRKIARAEARLEVLRSIDGLFQKPEEK